MYIRAQVKGRVSFSESSSQSTKSDFQTPSSIGEWLVTCPIKVGDSGRHGKMSPGQK
jgi:hypothetical protein